MLVFDAYWKSKIIWHFKLSQSEITLCCWTDRIKALKNPNKDSLNLIASYKTLKWSSMSIFCMRSMSRGAESQNSCSNVNTSSSDQVFSLAAMISILAPLHLWGRTPSLDVQKKCFWQFTVYAQELLSQPSMIPDWWLNIRLEQVLSSHETQQMILLSLLSIAGHTRGHWQNVQEILENCCGGWYYKFLENHIDESHMI